VPEAGQAQVHKWSYCAQAWHLILTGAPLFKEEIEAYAHGPVVASLWKAERHGRTSPEPALLDETGQLVLDHTDGRYIERIARARKSSRYSLEGRPVDTNILAALERASGRQHVVDPRP
jgi:uncharacterized phage-associated protein